MFSSTLIGCELHATQPKSDDTSVVLRSKRLHVRNAIQQRRYLCGVAIH
jgi:hypothetical protein